MASNLESALCALKKAGLLVNQGCPRIETRTMQASMAVVWLQEHLMAIGKPELGHLFMQFTRRAP